MRDGNSEVNRWLLFPAFLYGVGVRLRNYLYNSGILPSASYPIPIICVGNLAVGGTGKSPMVEYLLRLLQNKKYRVAVVSRGYKRESSGLVVATATSSAKEIGDEPCLMKRKFSQVTIVVDGNRKRALNYLCSLPQEVRPQVIVMDDGFQHRSVRPAYSILLSVYHRPLWDDKLLPAGRLREPITSRHRADMIVITKCPPQTSPIAERIAERKLELYPHQKMLFSQVSYGDLYPLFDVGTACGDRGAKILKSSEEGEPYVIALAGIAHPQDFFNHSKETYKVQENISYSDHHNYGKKDVFFLEEKRKKLLLERNLKVHFICTEKDAVKLRELEDFFSPTLKDSFWVQSIEPCFRADGAKVLEQEILKCICKTNERVVR